MSELVVLEMGLQEFQDVIDCPKCRFSGSRVVFHPAVILNMGEEEFPCAEWVRKGLLTGTISQHLCVRCTRCGYGYPMKTSDA